MYLGKESGDRKQAFIRFEIISQAQLSESWTLISIRHFNILIQISHLSYSTSIVSFLKF